MAFFDLANAFQDSLSLSCMALIGGSKLITADLGYLSLFGNGEFGKLHGERNMGVGG